MSFMSYALKPQHNKPDHNKKESHVNFPRNPFTDVILGLIISLGPQSAPYPGLPMSVWWFMSGTPFHGPPDNIRLCEHF